MLKQYFMIFKIIISDSKIYDLDYCFKLGYFTPAFYRTD